MYHIPLKFNLSWTVFPPFKLTQLIGHSLLSGLIFVVLRTPILYVCNYSFYFDILFRIAQVYFLHVVLQWTKSNYLRTFFFSLLTWCVSCITRIYCWFYKMFPEKFSWKRSELTINYHLHWMPLVVNKWTLKN